MSEQHPNADQSQPMTEEELEQRSADPRDLASKGGFTKDAREVVEHPGVTPQMLDEPKQERGGFIHEE